MQSIFCCFRYCIEFEVTKAAKSCRKDATYNLLKEGDRITVRCDLEAFINDEKIYGSNDSMANEVNDSDSPRASKNSENETIDDKEIYTVKSKYRCRGEGSTGRNTRFSALAVPSCRGKWMRLTVGQPKKCSYDDSQYIFV